MSIKAGNFRTSHYQTLPDEFYTFVKPQPLEAMKWACWNPSLAHEMGLDGKPSSELLSRVLSGQVNSESHSLAMKYAGHQFGVQNPDLGDGRGLLLCDIETPNGAFVELHLKGAGRTPYSRMGDGRAVLRSTIREYLASEAMAGLGIPTTRALAIISSESDVYRERAEPGAMLLRTTPTHIRFGHFEHFYFTKQHDKLQQLADFTIEHYYPHISFDEQRYITFFKEVVSRTASLIAKWQAVGFAHGVMNTDNMSILGETMDYGPYAFMDDYEPGLICNHSDYQGRYAFNMQPGIGLWNLQVLAYVLTPLIGRDELNDALESYQTILNLEYSSNMRAKLGLFSKDESDGELFESLFALMSEAKVDYTNMFRALSQLDHEEDPISPMFQHTTERAQEWLKTYKARCLREGFDGQPDVDFSLRAAFMRSVNPKFVMRNYLLQQAIELAEEGDYSVVETLLKLAQQPFDEHNEEHAYAQPAPDWGKELVISCSS